MNARDKILEAAREEFLKNGYDATRMRSIAERSEVNKGLLHYYFKSKDALITEVFQTTFAEFFASIGLMTESKDQFEKKLSWVIENYIAFLQKNPRLPWFILHEMERSPKEHKKRLEKAGVNPPAFFLKKLLSQGKEQGVIRKDLNEHQFIVTLMSLLLFPFVGKGMLQFVEGMSDTEYKEIIERRKTEVTEVILRYIQP